MSEGEARIEVVGELIVARLRGEPTQQLLRQTQEKVLDLVQDLHRPRILYDTLGMLPPPIDVPWSQRALDEKLGFLKLKRAIVVPNCKLAYLARLAFGDGDYRVFYNDMVGAVKWLNG